MPLADPPSSNHVQGPSVLDFASSSTSQQQQEQHDQGKEAPTLAGQEERLGQDEIQPATENVAAANMHLDPPHSARTSDRRLYDPEKTSLPASNHYYPVSDHDSRLDAQHHQVAMRGLKKDLGALVNFMTLMPFVSVGITLYTLFAILAIIFLSPLNLFLKNRSPLRTQLRIFLLPASNLHYKCAWSQSRASKDNIRRSWPGSPSSSRNHVHDIETPQQYRTMDAPSNFVLIVVHLLSPLVSIPMVFAAIIVALWWIMSAITADDTADGFDAEHPRREGQGGFDEGQNLARGLRNWWVGWLSGQVLR